MPLIYFLPFSDTELLITTSFRHYLITCDVSPNLATQDTEGVGLAVKAVQSKGTVQAGLEWLESHCPELLMGMHHWLLAHMTHADDPNSVSPNKSFFFFGGGGGGVIFEK